MFGSAKLLNENIKLKQQIEKLEDELKSHKSVIKKINEELCDTEFGIDWSTMNAFSIERNASNNIPVTIIGYYTTQKETSENGTVLEKPFLQQWYLYCSDKRHRELVKEFKEFKSKK